MLYPIQISRGVFVYCICIIMWHSHLNDMEIPETKRFIPRGFELGTLSRPNRSIGPTKTSQSIPNLKGLLCCMTLPSVVVPQKRKWSHQTKMRARLPEYILILLFSGDCPRIDTNGAPRRSKQCNKRDWDSCKLYNFPLAHCRQNRWQCLCKILVIIPK